MESGSLHRNLKYNSDRTSHRYFARVRPLFILLRGSYGSRPCENSQCVRFQGALTFPKSAIVDYSAFWKAVFSEASFFLRFHTASVVCSTSVRDYNRLVLGMVQPLTKAIGCADLRHVVEVNSRRSVKKLLCICST